MLSSSEMKIISNNQEWGNRIGLSWVFETRNLLQEMNWLAEQLQEARTNGYLPVSINQDDPYSYNNQGKTKIVVILENRKVNLSESSYSRK
jgi:hypothetical protein